MSQITLTSQQRNNLKTALINKNYLEIDLQFKSFNKSGNISSNILGCVYSGCVI